MWSFLHENHREQHTQQNPFVDGTIQHKCEGRLLSGVCPAVWVPISWTKTTFTHISPLCALVPSTGEGRSTNTFIMHLLLLDTVWGCLTQMARRNLGTQIHLLTDGETKAHRGDLTPSGRAQMLRDGGGE